MARVMLSPIVRDNPAENNAIQDIKRLITTSISPPLKQTSPHSSFQINNNNRQGVFYTIL